MIVVVNKGFGKEGIFAYTALREITDGLRESAGDEATKGDERGLHLDGLLRVGEKMVYYDICSGA